MAEKTQRNNILLAFLTLLGVTAGVSIIGLFTLRKGPENHTRTSRSNRIPCIK